MPCIAHRVSLHRLVHRPSASSTAILPTRLSPAGSSAALGFLLEEFDLWLPLHGHTQMEMQNK